MTLEEQIVAADARFASLIEKVRSGGSLSRRERAELAAWLMVRQTDYLLAIAQRLSAPSEIPSELSDHEG